MRENVILSLAIIGSVLLAIGAISGIIKLTIILLTTPTWGAISGIISIIGAMFLIGAIIANEVS